MLLYFSPRPYHDSLERQEHVRTIPLADFCESIAPSGYHERTSELDECSNLCWHIPAAWDYGVDRSARV
jgi:hypothetical protein